MLEDQQNIMERGFSVLAQQCKPLAIIKDENIKLADHATRSA